MSDSLIVNHYNTLGIRSDASLDEIQAAVKETRKTWVLRQNAPSLERRQEAETMLARVADAEGVLLDPFQRTNYDKQLHDQTQKTRSPAPPAGHTDWIATAADALRRGDPAHAEWAAREATHLSPENPEAWALRGRADSQLGRLDDASFEFSRAAELDSNSAERHFELGTALQARGKFGPALAEYGVASSLAPQEPFYRAAIGRNFVEAGKPTMALQVLEPLAREYPNDEWVQRSLALALCDAGLDSWHQIPDGPRIATTKEQAEAALAVWHRAQSLRFNDDALREEIRRRISKGEYALAKEWVMSGRKFILLLVIALLVSANMGQVNVALGWIVLAGCLYGIVTLARKPHYKISAGIAKRRQLQTR
jgi:Flp pilus assembly protein TadD